MAYRTKFQLLVVAAVLLAATAFSPLHATDQPDGKSVTVRPADGPRLSLQVVGRDAEMTMEVLRLLTMDLGIFGFRVADPAGSEAIHGTISLKVSGTMEKTSWRSSKDRKARLECRRLVLKGSFKSDDASVRILEEDVAGCFLTERESLEGGLFQRTRQTAEGVWVETDTSLVMRLIRRLEIEIYGAMASEQSVRALLALYWEFPDQLGPRILDIVRGNRKKVIPVLESLYEQAEGSEKAAAAAILARYAD